MRNLLALVGLAVVAVAGAGWYLGWYKVSRHEDKIEIQADTTRATQDIKKGVKAIEEFADKHQGTGSSIPSQPQIPPAAPPSMPQLPPMPSLPSLPGIPDPPSTPGSVTLPQLPQLPPAPIPTEMPNSSWQSK